MSKVLSLAALVSAGLAATSNALAPAAGVSVSANAWDTRIEGWGCAPAGCVADNVLDDSLEPEARWSCRGNLFLPGAEFESTDDTSCMLTFKFDGPQDVKELRMALWKGEDRARAVNVWVDGVLATTLDASGATNELEAYELTAASASTVVLEYDGLASDWISITEVQIMVESSVEEVESPAEPEDDDYVGCFSDMVGDRILFTVETDAAMTIEVCAAKCAETNKYFYGLQQGNECWCSGCDLTELDTNTNYDRHGDGVCATPCAGDASQTCGGDMSISLYQSTTCMATPAPTPTIPESDCPTDSTPASLEIILSRSNEYMMLQVTEPGGKNLTYGSRRGDVGTWGELSDDDYESGVQSYILMNDLSVDSDMVLGDYMVQGLYSREGGRYTITARSGGELLWIAGGELGKNEEQTPVYTATVTEYVESDCYIPDYGRCPGETISSDGLPPCTSCPEGKYARAGSTFCTDASLRGLGLSEAMANTMSDDAIGGFAGPGSVELYNRDRLYWGSMYVSSGTALGTVQVSGAFTRNDDSALSESLALFLYIENEDAPEDFVRGEGIIDPSTGNFTATITDIPPKYSRGFLSFVSLDIADAPGGQDGDGKTATSVFAMNIVNEGCSEALRVALQWEGESDLNLWVTEPGGKRLSRGGETIGDVGYLNIRNGGGWTIGNPDTGKASGEEEYVVFSGLSGDSMLGEYSVFVRPDWIPDDEEVTWLLTASVDGAIVWEETGTFKDEFRSSDTSDSFTSSSDSASSPTSSDDAGSERRLYTTSETDDVFLFDDDDFSFSDDYTSYSDTYFVQSDVFTVSLDSYDAAAGC